MECRTTKVISVSGGRSSQFGDSTILIFDIQTLHAVAQLAERNAQKPSGGSAVEAGLAERLQDRFALQAVEVRGQRGVERCLRRFRLRFRFLFVGGDAVKREVLRAE